jgi:division protein CdvB (Snf7/Vps24/ESCRT-III family)
MQNSRMNFSQWIDKIFWVLLAFFANTIVNEASEMNKNIKLLNDKMATLVANVGNQEKRLDSMDYRIQSLEASRYKK